MKTYKVDTTRRFFLHSGGTKYYVTQKVTIKEVDGDHEAERASYFLTNYGKYDRGTPIADYTCRRGGTTSCDEHDNVRALDRAETTEIAKRIKRGYEEQNVISDTFLGEDLNDLLANQAMIPLGHVMDMVGRVTGEPAKAGKLSDDMDELIRAKKAKMEEDKRAFRDVGKTMPPPPAVEIDRGAEWGSW